MACTGRSSSTPDGGRRLGRDLQPMTPTFSLGCGTWGGSNTTDNINYRNLLNIKTVSHRQAPPQWFRVPSDTYFNAGAIENLRGYRSRSPARHRRGYFEFRGVPETLRAAPRRGGCSYILRYPPGADRGADPGGRRCDLPVRARGDPRRRRRLGPRRCESDAALPRESRADDARAFASFSMPASGSPSTPTKRTRSD